MKRVATLAHRAFTERRHEITLYREQLEKEEDARQRQITAHRQQQQQRTEQVCSLCSRRGIGLLSACARALSLCTPPLRTLVFILCLALQFALAGRNRLVDELQKCQRKQWEMMSTYHYLQQQRLSHAKHAMEVEIKLQHIRLQIGYDNSNPTEVFGAVPFVFAGT